jgi:hypothetical protein
MGCAGDEGSEPRGYLDTGGSRGTGGAAGTNTGGAAGDGGAAGASGGGTGGAQSGGGGAAGDGGSSGSGGSLGTGGPCAFENDAQFCACLGKTCGGDTIADKDGKFHSVYCGSCPVGGFCAAVASPYGGAVGVCNAGGGLTRSQKEKAEMMTSIWENGTPNKQYGYSEDIGDGRGYTSGRAGFCTGTGDGIIVIECYDLAKPGNAMEKYMPALVVINEAFAASGGTEIQDSKDGLDGFPDDWGNSADDEVFRGCQDGVSDAVYYGVALRHVAEKKFTTALTKAALYDAQINQGEADPRFGMIYMMGKADDATGPMSDPPTLDDEDKWLNNFLKIRDDIMKQYPEWAGNRYRVSTYQKIRAAKNWDLSQCIVTDSDTFTIVTSGDGAKASSGSSCN